ncbi:MAG: hypothetical protein ABSH33_06820 [Steroidobacteraceae bacterium]|jgi:hypothetical protein
MNIAGRIFFLIASVQLCALAVAQAQDPQATGNKRVDPSPEVRTPTTHGGLNEAAPANPPPTMTKHQMIVQTVSCMRKRMSSGKPISYHEAAKACKDQLDKQRDNSTAGALVASDAPAKQ